MLRKKKSVESYLSQIWVKSESDLDQISTRSLTSSNQSWYTRNTLTLSDRRQQHCRLIYTLDNVIWLMHLRRWSETDNQKNKSRQSIKHLRHFKQSAANRSCRTDLDTDEFIQCMCNTQISFEAVQKSSNDSTMQIKEKRLYWFENISTHCSAWYHEQSFEVDHD